MMNIRRIQIFLVILVFLNANLLAAQSKASAQVTPPEKYLGFKPGAASFAMMHDGDGPREMVAKSDDDIAKRSIKKSCAKISGPFIDSRPDGQHRAFARIVMSLPFSGGLQA